MSKGSDVAEKYGGIKTYEVRVFFNDKIKVRD